MSETTVKKKRLHNVATELNLASDTIVEFLRKKGYDLKVSPMTVITDEMHAILLAHYKKEKDSAERHQRKVNEFKASRKKEPGAKLEKEIKPLVAKKPKEKPIIVETSIEEPLATSEERDATKDAPISEAPETAVVDETASSFEQVPPPITEVTELIEVQTVEAKHPAGAEDHHPSADVRRVLSPLEKVTAQPKRGLTIKGKIELSTSKAKEPTSGTETSDAGEAAKKKKKKKKIKDDGKTGKTASPDEDEKIIKRRRSKVAEVSAADVDKAIKETFAEMEDVAATQRAVVRKKKRKEREEKQEEIAAQQELEKSILRVTEFVSVGELANLMNVSVAEVIQKCIGLGMMVSINQRLDKDTITLVSDEFGFQVSFSAEFAPDELAEEQEMESHLQNRPPVVTIMGHVDHGKTSLLDYIRNANVVAGEAGGITQHIGAYRVGLPNGKKISFLDTPGHEAFTAMRARGAQVTDIVVLVVAADDSVMPQTWEAISHAQAANVPIIIAINKIDKADANPERIRQQLSDRGILVEEWGGKYQCVEISAKKGLNIELLLEKILLEAEVMDLKANPDRLARGVVIETQLDKGKGIVSTILIQKGTLRIGDPFVAGMWSGRVRAMFDERGNKIDLVYPSEPVQMIGFDGIPQAGDQFIVVEDERTAREISNRRVQLKREQDFRQHHVITLDEFSKAVQQGNVKELRIVVKGDVDGSVEAVADSLMKLSTAEVTVNVIHKGVGAISESDVLLASASDAIIVGFHVRPNLNARRIAEQESVDIRLYNIIYNAINEVRTALEGMLAPTISEQVTSTVEVREVYKISHVGTIAGCYVTDGKITRNNKVRLVRDGIVTFEGTISSLKRFKDDVREVEQGYECGISLENFNDIKLGDVIESFVLVESKRKLG